MSSFERTSLSSSDLWHYWGSWTYRFAEMCRCFGCQCPVQDTTYIIDWNGASAIIKDQNTFIQKFKETIFWQVCSLGQKSIIQIFERWSSNRIIEGNIWIEKAVWTPQMFFLFWNITPDFARKVHRRLLERLSRFIDFFQITAKMKFGGIYHISFQMDMVDANLRINWLELSLYALGRIWLFRFREWIAFTNGSRSFHFLEHWKKFPS